MREKRLRLKKMKKKVFLKSRKQNLKNLKNDDLK